MEIYKSLYLIIKYDDEKSLITYLWQDDSRYMSDEIFKKEVSAIANLIDKYKPKLGILDMKFGYFPLTKETQKWVFQNIISRSTKSQLRKVAIITSYDLMSQVSLEKVFEADTSNIIERQYFVKIEKALEWLLSDTN